VILFILVTMSDTLVVNEIYLSLQGESTFAGLPCIFIRLTACDLRCSYCDTTHAFTEGKKMPPAKILAEVRRLAEPFFSHFLSLTPGFSRVDGRERVETVSTASRMQKTAEAVEMHTAASATGLKPGANEMARLPLVELTGGEPLLQKNSLPLMKSLCNDGFTVLLETGGAHDISKVDPRVHRIMDLKCPGSGEVERNRWENLKHLKTTDEIKFVIGTVEDYEWAGQKIAEYRLNMVCPLLFSWVHPLAPEQQSKGLKQVPPGQKPISRRELAEKIVADALPVRFQAQLHKIIWPPERRGV
jgi:7-carboxy-7-deazaguanine synthase